MSTQDTDKTLYDEVPYFAKPFAEAHIDRLAALATLFGLKPPPLATCRVLELGCSQGGHLIPMAAQFPKAQFLGIDLSAAEIADGQERVEALGLTNIELRQLSITDVTPELGEFDYIVSHGVYSWVPDDVRKALLRVCGDNLAPNGVVYVSYNCLPGWRMRSMLRDMMTFHSQSFDDPDQRVEQARALLDFLVDGTDKESLYGKLVRNEVRLLRQQPDHYVFHDHLAPVNTAWWFWEFARDAGEVGLEYLGDAHFSTMVATRFNDKTARALAATRNDIVRQEQYMDFLCHRAFRRTLLVHDGSKLDRHLSPETLRRFVVASTAKPTGPVSINSAAEVEFRTRTDEALSTHLPLLKAALYLLSEHPKGLPFDELVAKARQLVGGEPSPHDRKVVGGNLLSCYAHGVVELRVTAYEFETRISERPTVSALARLQAGRNDPVLCNQRHESVGLSEFDRQLLVLLDGTRTPANAAAQLVNNCVQGKLSIEQEGKPVTDPVQLARMFGEAVPARIEAFCRWALLVA